VASAKINCQNLVSEKIQPKNSINASSRRQGMTKYGQTRSLFSKGNDSTDLNDWSELDSTAGRHF
jgi:hypothetical protein